MGAVVVTFESGLREILEAAAWRYDTRTESNGLPRAPAGCASICETIDRGHAVSEVTLAGEHRLGAVAAPTFDVAGEGPASLLALISLSLTAAPTGARSNAGPLKIGGPEVSRGFHDPV